MFWAKNIYSYYVLRQLSILENNATFESNITIFSSCDSFCPVWNVFDPLHDYYMQTHISP